MIHKSAQLRFLSWIIAGLSLILVLPLEGNSQETATQNEADSGEETINFSVDHATFESREDRIRLEVYLLIPRTEFEFVMPDTLDHYVARGYVFIGLAQDDSIRYVDRWPINDRAENLEDITNSQNIPDISYFEVPPGTYELIVQVIDLHTDVRGLYREPVTLNEFDDTALTISDIEIASQVEAAEQNTIFTKAEHNIIPNASLTFSTGLPVLYSYAEIYNLEYPSDNDSIEIQYSILDLNNTEVRQPQVAMVKKTGNISVNMGGLNVIGLPAGIYRYRIRVTDLHSGEVATRSKRFYVYKPSSTNQPMVSNISGIDYASMEEDELDTEFDSMRPLLDNTEVRNFRRAGIEGKRNLLRSFWDKRDPDPSTAINELQIEYSRRLEFVKANYGSQQEESYTTDRGRIYLVYGEPDEVERNPMSINARPYEIWSYYSVQGGVEFIFVDQTGFGSYQLVHSTARGELYDPNWQEYIQSSPTSTY